MTFIHVLLISALALSLFFSLLIFTKKDKGPADKILFGWMLVLAYHAGAYISAISPGPNHNLVIELSGALVLIHGPLSLMYIHAIHHQRTPPPALYAHFIPLGLYLLLIPMLIRYDWGGLDISMGVIKVLSCLMYPLIALWKLKKHEAQLEALVSDLTSRRLVWFKMVVTGLFLIALVAACSLLFTEWGEGAIDLNGELFIAIALACFIFIIGYFGFRQTTHFVDIWEFPAASKTDEAPAIKPAHKPATEKYQKTGLDAAASKEKFAELTQLMKTGKPFLDPEITRLKLAERMQIPPHQLSQIINQNTEHSFFTFVSQYRVEAVIERFQAGEHATHTLLSIALDAGFNSKASFNRVFKQVTGDSPSAYIRKHPSS
ncbi:MAG: helix-turn-helix domain-containing protein [Bacteroidota bacterium]